MKKKSVFPLDASVLLRFLFATAFIVLGFNSFGQHRISFQDSGPAKIINLLSGERIISTIPVSIPKIISTSKQDTEQPTQKSGSAASWGLKFSAPGKVFKDISFADTQTGYIVTELGGVYKSVNGGDNWSSVMNLGFPYYWYGVDALTPDTVVISGFNNQASFTQGVVRWTFDGGNTWEEDINLTIPATAVGWLDRIHFFNQDTGIVINSFSGGCWYTVNGGKDAASWTYVTINPDLAWFAGNIDPQPSGRVYATGIHFAQSSDFGINWLSGPCADVVFDGGVDVLNEDNLLAWTGGGQISAPVQGWICRSTDGGFSWSPRLQVFPYPIRALQFLDESRGWAVGGNLYDEAGGIYSTTDGGLTWNLEISTSAEMFSMEFKPVSSDSTDVWCVGSTGGGTGYTGKLYKTRIASNVTGIGQHPSTPSESLILHQNVPNPFGEFTTINFSISTSGHVTLKVYDINHKEITTLVDEFEYPGNKSVQYFSKDLPNGVYYYQLQAGNRVETRKMIITR